MQQLAYYVSKYGLSLIFVNVLFEQLGLPIPAIPVLVVAGALAVERDLSVPRVLLVALLASLIADVLWYALGKRYGFRILKTLCRVSLSPDGCVRQTTSIFEKWGLPSLVVAKFVPGFSTVAPPLAGAINARLLPFLLYDGAGALVSEAGRSSSSARRSLSSSWSSGGSGGASTRCCAWPASPRRSCTA